MKITLQLVRGLTAWNVFGRTLILAFKRKNLYKNKKLCQLYKTGFSEQLQGHKDGYFI